MSSSIQKPESRLQCHIKEEITWVMEISCGQNCNGNKSNLLKNCLVFLGNKDDEMVSKAFPRRLHAERER